MDLETANPVVTIDRTQITNSGKVTLGDLVQDLPAVTGSPQNTRVNNGGGTGGTFASLRGLGTGRTLVLVDGRRVTNNDLNIIPAELVERVEVLNDGGSVVYGSDAIGGVINFILRKDYQGAEFSVNYGISDRDDAERRGVSFIFGQTSDKGSILAGVDYNKFDPVGAGSRDFSKDALYLYYGNIYAFGSSRNPYARAILATTDVNGNDVFAPGQAGVGDGSCSSATLKSNPGDGQVGTAGDGSSLADYKCYTGADSYNYQTLNYDLTPQERTNAFFKGDYQLSDNIQAYMDVFHNKTTSAYAIAPLPFDALSDGVTISQYSMYNPFGVDFGPPQNNAGAVSTKTGDFVQNSYEFLTRFTGVGQRSTNYTTTTDQGVFGVKGGFGQSSWTWDANYNYGHISQLAKGTGDLVYNQQFRNAVGPSMLDPVTGQPICVSTPGDATTVISGCTPINMFGNQNDPAIAATEAPYAATFFNSFVNVFRSYNASVTGNLFSLPAGDAQLAVGADYRTLYSHSVVSYLSVIDANPNSPTFGQCQGPQSACSASLQGGYNVKEAYAELFIPILKDVPFVQSLNVTLGDRYSKYSLAGSTNNTKIAVEWRPIDDLLLRGTIQDVFRAPTIGQLFTSPTGNAPQFSDPCIGLDAATLAAHANACQNVAPNATFQSLQNGLSQTTGVVSGSVAAGYPLKPEFGKSFDFGFVYDPHFVPGLSVNADLWRIYLNDTITTVGAQTAANVCFANNSSPLCALIHRRANGQVQFISQPTVNLGRLDTRGVDLGVHYRVPQVGWLPGQVTLGLEATYLAEFTNNTVPGDPNSQVSHVAGHFYTDYGSYPRWRGQLNAGWKLGAWDASWRVRYIGHEVVGSCAPAENQSADGAFEAYCFRVPDIIYNDIQVGYNIEPINTQISIGVDNAFDKQPPIFTQTNVLNGDTDVNTYDTIGRFYWARATVKF
ncbi:MAG TPA: TonB-dependent receptor [Rhodanobacteraceae bacterium]